MSKELIMAAEPQDKKVKITTDHELSALEKVLMQGDLSKLTSEQRVLYYNKVCESQGLNPFTRPFEYISMNGKLTLYAKKDATEQLRKINGISIESLEGKVVDDLYIVVAIARTKDGRTDQSTGAVTIGNLKGEAKANAIMKAETKAKRRVTLSISGMGWMDESEIDSIPHAKHVDVDLATGEIKSLPHSSVVNIQAQVEAIPDPVMDPADIANFYKNFNGDEEWTRKYVEFYMAKKKSSESQAILAMQKDLEASQQVFEKWKAKQKPEGFIAIGGHDMKVGLSEEAPSVFEEAK